MDAWVGVHRWKVAVVAVALVCIGVGVLVVAHRGSARTESSARLPGCVNNASATTSPQCTHAAGRMPAVGPHSDCHRREPLCTHPLCSAIACS